MSDYHLSLSAAFDLLPEPVCCCAEQRLVYCNQAFRTAFPALTEGEPLPEPWGNLIPFSVGAAEGWRFTCWSWEDLMLLRLRREEQPPLIPDRRLPLLAARIREPLTALTYAQESMEDILGVFQQEELERDFARMNQSTLRLLRLVQTLSLAGCPEDETPPGFLPRPIDLNGLCRDTAEQLRDLLPRLGWTLDVHPCRQNVFALCDDILVQIQLYHLVSNAVKGNYPRHGRMELRVERRGKLAIISLSDDGVGMTPAQMEAAFDPARNNLWSLGVGLMACSRIARLHGGTVVLSNRSPKGLRASISLPLCSPERAEVFREPRMIEPAFHGVPLVLRELSDILPADCFQTCDL